MKSSVQKKCFKQKPIALWGLQLLLLKIKFYFNEFNSSNEVFAA